MMDNRIEDTILGLLIILLIMGCAGPPTLLKQEDIRDIRRLAVVTFLSDKNLRIVDHTGIRGHLYGRPSQYYGLMGALQVVIVEDLASGAVKASLGGDPDALKEAVGDFPVKEVFDEMFAKVFSMNFEVVSPQEVDNLRIEGYPERESVGGKTIRDYTILSKSLGVDAVLQINFIYGLAGYGGYQRPSAVISGFVSIIDIKDNKLLMRKIISSDSYYKKGYTVDEFKTNQAELFKKEILEAIRWFARLVASEFGVELSLKEKSYWRPSK